MKTINASTLPRCVPAVLDDVEAGELYTVTRGKEGGEPKAVAAIVPVADLGRDPEWIGFLPGGPDVDLARRVVDFLQELIDLDADAVGALIAARVPCSRALADHPTVQAGDAQDLLSGLLLGHPAGFEVGILGLLNGLVGADDDGRGVVSVIVDEDGTVTGAKLLTDRVPGSGE